MGMDECRRSDSHQQVMLGWAGADENQIAALQRPPRRPKSGPRDKGQMAGDVGVAQRVAGGRFGAAECSGDESHAIDASGGLAPAKPESCANQRLDGIGELAGRDCGAHRGIG